MCSLMNSYRREAEEHGAKVVLNSEVVGGQVSGELLYSIHAKSITYFCCTTVGVLHAVNTVNNDAVGASICNEGTVCLNAELRYFCISHMICYVTCLFMHIQILVTDIQFFAHREYKKPPDQGQRFSTNLNSTDKNDCECSWSICTGLITQAARPASRNYSSAVPCQGPLLHNGRSV